MCKIIYILVLVGLSNLLILNAQAQACDNFRECYDLGHTANDAGEPAEALAYYQKACFMEAADAFLNLRNNACRSVTKISGELDNYSSAYTFFNSACEDNKKDAGCFHLALLEEDRNNLQRALQIMQPLCDKKFIIHRNVYSTGCTEYKRMQQIWEIQHPRQPRDNTIQIPLLVVTLLLPLLATGFLFFKKYPLSLLLSGLAFLTYGYYEYGVSRYANIRIDLLIIFPALLLSLFVFIFSAVRSLKRNSGKGKNSGDSG